MTVPNIVKSRHCHNQLFDTLACNLGIKYYGNHFHMDVCTDVHTLYHMSIPMGGPHRILILANDAANIPDNLMNLRDNRIMLM